jgi:beta-mannosidase
MDLQDYRVKPVNVLDLNGTWKLHWSDGQRSRPEHALRDPPDESRFIDAQVPGEVHLDLLKAGWISDPCVGANVLAARWVEEFIWTYRRTFDLLEAPNGRAWLVFEGLDLYATILLNGTEIGRHHNTFYPCRIEVTGKLQPGTNSLIIHLDSGLWAVADKPASGWERWPDQILNKRHWLRKPQCQFGWDSSQRLINVGIFKPVRLEWTDHPARVDQAVALAEVSPDLKSGTLRIRMFYEGLSPQPRRARITVRLPKFDLQHDVELDILPGPNTAQATLHIDNPDLWWPVGQGPQTRYAVQTRLESDGITIHEQDLCVGFRHVQVDQSPNPVGGRYFTFIINGRKIFAKGSNFVPADMIFARIDRSRYEKLIDLALEQNFNFLRVWGGGLYESDDFYDLCDERGILVWQEFIFACTRYPTHDEDFFNDVRAEATYNIRRLARHPSLVAWCGNNEIEWGDWDWDYGRTGVIMPDHAFFHITLPRLLQQEDPTRYYQPRSPYSPDTLHPNSDHVGDQHPWSLGFFNYDFRDYRKMTCRFPDEGGYLGPTSLPTMLACLPETQRHIHSFAWQIHDNSVASWTQPSAPDEAIRQWLGKDPHKMSIEDFNYWTGLLQGEALREYIENFRRRMFDSSAAVFWMFNDCWPATRSWTTVDYYLRRTPAFHHVRRAMAPVHVILAQEGDAITIFGINDMPERVDATLSFGILPLKGNPSWQQEIPASLYANASTRLATIPLSLWPDPRNSIAFAKLRRDNVEISQNRLILPRFRELQWSAPDIRISAKDGAASFESSSFAWGICLDLGGELRLADNFFDLYPSTPYAIPWPHASPPRVLRVGDLFE